MFYTGIDLSLTGTGLIVLDEDSKIVHQSLICTGPKNIMEHRHHYIKETIKNTIKDFQPSRTFIEGLSFGSRGQSMLDLAGLHFVIRNYLFENDIPFEVVPPTVLKKFVTGKGTAKKELMLLQVYKKFGIEFRDNNICDAYCLAKYSLEKSK